MLYIIKRISLAFLCTAFSLNALYSQEVIFDDKGIAREQVVDESVKTIQLYREGWIDSYPILIQGENLQLILEFDELSNQMNDFYYTIYHCDADWTRSDLTENEYMDGYYENRIDQAEPSFNTYINYYHYSVGLPNSDLNLKLSGNYILVVYRDQDLSQLAFTKRFMITESKVTVKATAHRPVLTEYRENSHEVDVTVFHPAYDIPDPYGETYLSIFQNGIWNFGITGLEPSSTRPGELVYDYQEENIFPAGNEFRMFNTRNTQVKEAHINNIEYLDAFHFELKPDKPNPPHLYFDRDDLNGRFFIEAANVRDPAVEADYTYVHFRLQTPLPYYNSEVYIAGALTNWQFTDMNRMHYDNEVMEYRASLLLKQGNQNYRYILLPDDSNSFDLSAIEGSHYQTRNEYLILFYHRQMGDRYDRLVGHQVIHSGG